MLIDMLSLSFFSYKRLIVWYEKYAIMLKLEQKWER